MLTTMTWLTIALVGPGAATAHAASPMAQPALPKTGPDAGGMLPRMPRKILTAGLTLVLTFLAAAGAARAETDRDPFVTPTTAANPYRYEKAIQQLAVQGIVRAEGARRIIIRIVDIDGLAILKAGDTIALNYMGLAHRFKVGGIRAKSVQFEAQPAAGPETGAPPAAGGRTYEVFVR